MREYMWNIDKYTRKQKYTVRDIKNIQVELYV